MSDKGGPLKRKQYLGEAYRFEEDCVFLLHHLEPVNSLESSERFLRRLLMRLIRCMRDDCLNSLQKRYKTFTKEKWMQVGRPTQQKVHQDYKKYLGKIPKVAGRKMMERQP
jgi:hypothetical protein